MNQKPNISDRAAIKLWYQGLGEAYHLSRGQLSSLGCQNDLAHRLQFYLIVGAVNAGLGIGGSFLAFELLNSEVSERWPELSWLVVVIFIAVIIAFYKAYILLTNWRFVSLNHNNDSNSDLCDPVRMNTLKKAVNWGVKKRLVQFKDGTWSYSPK